MRLTKFVFFFSFIFSQEILAQKAPIHYGLEGQTILTGEKVPFWMRSNQYGSVPLGGASMSLIGRASKDYAIDTTGKRRLFDWGVGFEGRANLGSGSNFIPVEAYGKIRLAMFEMKAGRSKDIMGLCDTLLSSGSFAVSGNALGIPKIQLSIPEFYTLPVLGGWVAIKGNLAHGWLGELPTGVNNVSARTYFHQKSLYGRIGKKGSRSHFVGGFNHQVFWGNEKYIFGNSFTYSNIDTFYLVIQGKNWAGSKVGNHLGTIDAGVDISFKNFTVKIYRQQFYDKGALYYLANAVDGLSGLSISRLPLKNDQFFQWKNILVEVLHTKNQAGYLKSRETPSGREDYYNSYIYSQGWSYQGYSLGTPLLTLKNDVKKEVGDIHTTNTFVNNRVFALHFGLISDIQKYQIELKTSYSLNYGTFESSGMLYRSAFGSISQSTRYFGKQPQLSASLGWSKQLSIPLYWGGLISVDRGNMLENAFGILVKFGIKF
jgi:hypothetical protein